MRPYPMYIEFQKKDVFLKIYNVLISIGILCSKFTSMFQLWITISLDGNINFRRKPIYLLDYSFRDSEQEE